MDSIHLEYREVSALKLRADPLRTHPPKQIHALRKSLQKFGFAIPVLIDSTGTVLDGNAVVTAAIAEGITQAPCICAEHLNDTQLRALALAANRLAELSEWDALQVSAELQLLKDAGIDITLTGFTDEDILLEAVEAEEHDFDPDPPAEPVTKPGDLWQLGRHRLLCGDATAVDDVDRLVISPPDLLLTDPPYNVDVTGGTTKKLKILNDNQEPDKFLEFLTAAFNNARRVLKPGAPFYIWHPDGEQSLYFRLACNETKLQVRQCLIWVKNQAVLSRQDYHWQHEPCLHGEALECGERWEEHESCLYGWKAGAAHLWCADRKQTTVLQYDKPSRSEDHPTMKPVKLFAYEIANSTLPDAVVFDPFGGSGTTLDACEQLGRTCYIMDNSPGYCDVIVRRWETLTGEKAVLVSA